MGSAYNFKLLAKKPESVATISDFHTLSGHLKNVFDVSSTLLTKLGNQALDVMDIKDFSFDEFSFAVNCSSLIHDLGKANSHFQTRMYKNVIKPQAFRHELIGAWLFLAQEQLRDFVFSDVREELTWCILMAVIGHHLKFRDASLRFAEGCIDTELKIYTDHPDFKTCLLQIQKTLKSDKEIPHIELIEIDILDDPFLELLFWIPKAYEWFTNSSSDTKRFVALVKAWLIAVDVAGSAIPQNAMSLTRWATDVLTRTCTKEDLTEIVTNKLGEKQLRSFQKAIADSHSRVTIVKAGCASGKTIAAYLWAANHAINRKLFFCYPTTGTATEGFRDYIISSELSCDSLLLHSRSEYDLEYLTQDADFDPHEVTARLESLSTWDVPLVVCTADSVLGIIQNYRKSLFAFPCLLNGSFIFDEIHQYDSRLFGALLRFLETFRNAHSMVMTASLSQERTNAICSLLSNSNISYEIIEGPKELEQIPRYKIVSIDGDAIWKFITSYYQQNKKILFVVNSVERCMKYGEEARSHNLNPIIYHSRFRYSDRLVQHNKVIESFTTAGPTFALTTQVCEVSLDISADLMITEYAPIPSIIQRLGRLNRRAKLDSSLYPFPVIFLNPPRTMPYTEKDISSCIEWIATLPQDGFSQEQMAVSFENIISNETISPVNSTWLTGGIYSAQASLRELDATIPVIRAEDQKFCVNEKGRAIPKELTKYTIPMLFWPVAREIKSWKQLSYLLVAPPDRIEYFPETGARWR